MYKSSLRHIHDPVLLPSKVEVICLSHLPSGVYVSVALQPNAGHGLLILEVFVPEMSASIPSYLVQSIYIALARIL